jgi:signal transduction histidine kinase
MNAFTLSNILLLATSLPLGYFVYYQNKTQGANRLWYIYTLSLDVWGICALFMSLTNNPEFALWLWRVSMGLGVIWMPVLFYHFAYLYAPWKEEKRLKLAYIITIIFAISAFTPFYIPKVELVFGAFYWARPGIAFYLLVIWWFALTGYSHTKLLNDSKNMPKERQNQIKYFIFASSVGYLGGLWDFSIVFGLPFYPWGNFLIVIYPFIMTYAIIKHGLFDIFIFIKRAFLSAILVGFIAASVSAIGFLNQYVQIHYGLSPFIAPLIAGVLTVYIIYLFSHNSQVADQAKREFITVAAHKLRTPLTHIRYIAEELKQVKTEEDRNELIKEMTESNDIMINLVNRLLDAVNIETQEEKYKFEPIDIKNITDEVLNAVSAIGKYKKINIEFTPDSSLPKAEGNERTTKFIIQSLIENSLTYTPENGKIEIKIAADRGTITWTIKDTGIGIAKEDMQKVFDKFYRGQNALKTDTEGTGLALFMARNLVKRQGGYISLDSAGLGQGTRFWFTIPVSKK